MLQAFSRVTLILSLIALLALGVIFTQIDLADILGDDSVSAPATLAQPAQMEALTFFGSLDVAEKRSVVLKVGGEIEEVLVEMGDIVQANEVLLRLDTTQLDREVQRAEISLELARVALLEQGNQSFESDLAVAEANLELAKANLVKLEAGGVTEEEMAAASASAKAAWARYNEIQAGPSEARLQQLRAQLERTQLAVTQAQRAYNEIKWRDDVGRTPQAANLQRVTIDLNVAQAAYTEATQPPRVSEIQGALAAAQRAQHTLNELEKGVSEADLAVARARVSIAEAAVLRVKELDDSQRAAELQVSRALLGLDEAESRRDNALVKAPLAGMVLALHAEEGRPSSAGSMIAVIGDPNRLELVVGIPQDQMMSIAVGDPVTITRFGSDVSVSAMISKISPISLPGKGNSTFPVTVRLPADSAAQFTPGVFVSATFEQ